MSGFEPWSGQGKWIAALIWTCGCPNWAMVHNNFRINRMSAGFTDAVGRFVRSPAFKFFVIGGLILLLMIPLMIVYGLVYERQSNARTVSREVAGNWGADQYLSGPFLIVPYTVKRMVGGKDQQYEREVTRQAVFLPEQLDVAGKAWSKMLTRSIYDVSVYQAKMTLTGNFARPDIARLDPGVVDIHWQGAVIALGLSDVSGLKSGAELILDGVRKAVLEPSPGAPQGKGAISGIHARPFANFTAKDQAPDGFGFELALEFSGSSSLMVAPAGRKTNVQLNSDWPHPSFTGAFLPLKRSISADGFSASWSVPHLARSVPQSWSGNVAVLNKFTGTMSGVRFYIPIDTYDLVNRAVKYGVMFLAVAFGSVFVLELLAGQRIHAVQYLFVGFTMILFYVLLLSLAEHMGFARAYGIAAGVTGGMLSLYVGMVMRSRLKGLIMIGVFALLYGLLYFILSLEDYALVAGAITGFTLLTVTMFATIRVNWSGSVTAAASQHSPGDAA